jgi:hypothetical protein
VALGEWMPSQVPQADLAKQSRFFERGYEGSLCALCLGRAWPVCVARGGGGQDCSICLDEFHGLLLPPVIVFMDGGLVDGRGPWEGGQDFLSL